MRIEQLLYGKSILDTLNSQGTYGVVNLDVGYIYKFQVMGGAGARGSISTYNVSGPSNGAYGQYGIGFFDMRLKNEQQQIFWDIQKDAGANGKAGKQGTYYNAGKFAYTTGGSGGNGGWSAGLYFEVDKINAYMTCKGGKGGTGGQGQSNVIIASGGEGGNGGGTDYISNQVVGLADVPAQIKAGNTAPDGWTNARIVITRYIDSYTWYTNEINRLLNLVGNLDRNLYTLDSLLTFDGVVSHSSWVLAQDYSTDDDLKNAFDALQNVMNNLVTKAYQKLKDLRDSAILIVDQGYSPNSWARLTFELGLSGTMLSNTATSNVSAIGKLTERFVQLTSAINGLLGNQYNYQEQIRGEITTIQDGFFNDYDEENYTEKSYSAVCDAFLKVPAPGIATIESLQEAKAAILDAIDALVTKAWQNLSDKIDEINELDELEYTEQSWASLIAQRDLSNTLLGDTEKNDISAIDTLQDSLNDLNDAFDGLILNSNTGGGGGDNTGGGGDNTGGGGGDNTGGGGDNTGGGGDNNTGGGGSNQTDNTGKPKNKSVLWIILGVAIVGVTGLIISCFFIRHAIIKKRFMKYIEMRGTLENELSKDISVAKEGLSIAVKDVQAHKKDMKSSPLLANAKASLENVDTEIEQASDVKSKFQNLLKRNKKLERMYQKRNA